MFHRLLYLILPLMLISCGQDAFLDRREMYDAHTGAARVRINVDWLSLFGDEPTGMTAMFYPGSGSRLEQASNNVTQMDVNLEPDSFRTVIFNLTTGEFGSFSFNGIDDYNNLSVKLNTLQPPTARAWADSITFHQQPEDIGVALDTIVITPEMALTGKGIQDSVYEYNETPRKITSTLTVHVYIKGLEYAKSVQGSINGMADGYLITQQHPSSVPCSHFLTGWKTEVVNDSTFITCSIRTFGLQWRNDQPSTPDDQPITLDDQLSARDSTDNYLTLHFVMRDNKTVRTFRYPVGNLFRYSTDISTTRSGSDRASRAGDPLSSTGSLSLVLNLIIKQSELPHVEGDASDASGFNAEVDPWEDGGKTEITF